MKLRIVKSGNNYKCQFKKFSTLFFWIDLHGTCGIHWFDTLEDAEKYLKQSIETGKIEVVKTYDL